MFGEVLLKCATRCNSDGGLITGGPFMTLTVYLLLDDTACLHH